MLYMGMYCIYTGLQPQCAEIECYSIDILNAAESLSADPLSHGENIRIVCDYGFIQSGGQHLTCDTTSGIGNMATSL